MNHILLHKRTVAQPGYKFPVFYEARSIITLMQMHAVLTKRITK